MHVSSLLTLYPIYVIEIIQSPSPHREEVVSIVALLSADSILINSTAQREQAANSRAKFASSEGDHITLLNILRAFMKAKQNKVIKINIFFFRFTSSE